MDALGLFAAVVAVTLFPGGVYACAAAGGAAWAGRLDAHQGSRWTPAALSAAALLLFGAALVPLPQSPATELPGPGGAPANVLAALLLIGAGIALGTAPRWPRARVAAAIAASVPLLVLAAQAATLSFPVVVGLPGPRLAAARALAAAAILLAVPVLGDLDSTRVPRGLRALQVAVPALVAAVLLAPPGWSNIPAAAAAALALAGVAVYAAVLAGVRRVLRGAILPLACAAISAAIAAIVVTVLASR
ncbi:MAG TPA: hypothetical protein VN193_17485 [Candidatus Angelobacter sp.]|nr:hypothetical protein [Candidatus Angelobacter sp.]